MRVVTASEGSVAKRKLRFPRSRLGCKPMNTTILNRGLQHGEMLTLNHDGESDTIRIERQRIGILCLPTGRLLACDPFYGFRDTKTLPQNLVEFRRRLPPGEY